MQLIDNASNYPSRIPLGFEGRNRSQLADERSNSACVEKITKSPMALQMPGPGVNWYNIIETYMCGILSYPRRVTRTVQGSHIPIVSFVCARIVFRLPLQIKQMLCESDCMIK